MFGLVWQQVVLLVWFLIGLISVVAMVGKPRAPISHASAACSVIVFIILGLLVVSIG